MKRIGLILVLVMISSVIYAQFSAGLRVGGGLATLHTKDSETKFFRATPGWQAGIFAAQGISRTFQLQASLDLTSKGYRDYVRYGNIKFNDYYRVNYLELTPQFFITPRVGKGKILAGVGLSVGYGLGGRWKQKSFMDAIPSTHGKLIFVNDLKDADNDITIGVYGKKTDIGANLSLGYQFNNKLSALINAKASRYNIAPKSFGQKPNYDDRNYGINLILQYAVF
ncbi:MAG: hypothetical protein M9959_13020 [Chitinophagaceae bacterium]|nr:hypothetical protein [Chitinophagaceae bacterium]